MSKKTAEIDISNSGTGIVLNCAGLTHARASAAMIKGSWGVAILEVLGVVGGGPFLPLQPAVRLTAEGITQPINLLGLDRIKLETVNVAASSATVAATIQGVSSDGNGNTD